MRRAAMKMNHNNDNIEIPTPLVKWIKEWREQLSIKQALPLFLLVFKDDILELTGGPTVQRIVKSLKTRSSAQSWAWSSVINMTN